MIKGALTAICVRRLLRFETISAERQTIGCDALSSCVDEREVENIIIWRNFSHSSWTLIVNVIRLTASADWGPTWTTPLLPIQPALPDNNKSGQFFVTNELSYLSRTLVYDNCIIFSDYWCLRSKNWFGHFDWRRWDWNWRKRNQCFRRPKTKNQFGTSCIQQCWYLSFGRSFIGRWLQRRKAHLSESYWA